MDTKYQYVALIALLAGIAVAVYVALTGDISEAVLWVLVATLLYGAWSDAAHWKDGDNPYKR